MELATNDVLKEYPWLSVPIVAANCVERKITKADFGKCAPSVRALRTQLENVELAWECLDLRVFENDVTLVAKDGELYYLPREPESIGA